MRSRAALAVVLVSCAPAPRSDAVSIAVAPVDAGPPLVSDAAAAVRAPPPSARAPAVAWTGVYFTPVYGYLHLVETGGHVVGRWRRADRSAWGELEGRIEDATLVFDWSEHRVGIVGSPAAGGKGSIVFLPPDEGSSPAIRVTFDPDTTVEAVRQVGLRPDLRAVAP
jgi:hypothetical protein